MIRFSLFLAAFLFTTLVLSQEKDGPLRGSVSYVSSQNVYVRFTTTAGIEVGDTLFLEGGKDKVPALVVIQRSSISCVCPVSYTHLTLPTTPYV
jgi:hypothetical protein